MMFWSNSWAWWQVGLMWLAMIVFWALLTWLVFILVTGAVERPKQPGGKSNAMMMLAASWTSG